MPSSRNGVRSSPSVRNSDIDCLEANAHALARYAALCQGAESYPSSTGSFVDGFHTIERCQEVTEQTLKVTFTELFLQRVHLEGMILKPSMVVSGRENPRQAGVEEVAQRTLQCLKRTVPAAVPGSHSLGRQSAESATEHLNAMNAMGPHPWQVSFSYARALQDPALKAGKAKRPTFRRHRKSSITAPNATAPLVVVSTIDKWRPLNRGLNLFPKR